MSDPLISLAIDLKYKKISRLEAIEIRKRFELLNFALTNSIKVTYAILFAPCSMVQITSYGTNYATAYSRFGGDHYLTMHAELNEKFFRQTFTSFEMTFLKSAIYC